MGSGPTAVIFANLDENVYFANNSIATFATVDDTTKNITVSNIPNSFAGQYMTVYVRGIHDDIANSSVPISVNVTNQAPTLNTSYVLSDIDQYVDGIDIEFDITELFIDPEGNPMTYEFKDENGRFFKFVIVYRH